MNIEGKVRIGHAAVWGGAGEVFAVNADTGAKMEPASRPATHADRDWALELAWSAYPICRDMPARKRAIFLRPIADEIEAVGAPLIDRAIAETGLTQAERINGFCTGVELSRAMVHGGRFPSTGRSTSVATMAVERFLRPICYQNFPATFLPKPFQS